MVDRNMLSQIIVTTDSIDNNFLQESEMVYSFFSSPFSIPLIVPSASTIRRATNAKETEYSYLNYDRYGNMLSFSKYGSDPVVYLWGYNYLYPIAEIKGVQYSDVTAKIASSTLDAIAAKNEPTTTDMSTINNLRTQLPNAQVTTYTYKPLVGIQSMTDPRGVVTNYNYDSFGRLKSVFRAGKQEEWYDYHYKN
jgi:YD repeat-containing protein